MTQKNKEITAIIFYVFQKLLIPLRKPNINKSNE